ncbi:hypothetical protein PhiCh1p29 [Natrialba phage PhiCh1]|uniref:Virus protein phiCh1-VP28 n=2 Tax=root TaxID=1 RepID=D3T2H5_NATMM|nr:Gp138 family membrane-puncturing spike protein [Natrialba magadii]NP_665946.1 hypothetical protein PhiCh1p29 [Natrialba phage PhiCh1]YP_010078056.1 uncharacterized protein KMC42_gp26 [Natrialba phage PhiCh1]AAM88702.1 unknown [Natrialba phage PhiCh1]ADD07784.1 virus protein phiCh1-VP28 [Natrialba magadii ATCC 43099]ELY23031.1 hypothetical protein C500_21245 [Natrialba magadii ATCC 43099]QBJ01207.1 uncharacterized protein PhiCh1_125 [Natrialba phage PhiCh1]
MPSNLISELKGIVRSEVQSAQTVTFVRVEEVDDDRRATVSLKRDSDLLIDNVPIASTWAGDGFGVVIPVDRGVEGLVLHPKEPLEKQIQQRGEQEPGSERRFELEDAVFFPQLWLDEDDVPDHEDDEFVVKHESGSEFRLDDDGVHVEPELFVDGIAFTEHSHDFDYDGGGEDSSSLSGTTEAPDE